MTAGYSNKPLAEKLGWTRGMRVWFHHMPDSVREEIDPEEIGLEEQPTVSDGLQGAHLFCTDRATMDHHLRALRPLLASNAIVWISWPKKAAKVETDITEDVVREVALPTGLVDVKVCAIDEIWSGLKLMVRKELR